MTALQPACQPEVVRSHQKDDQYIQIIQSSLNKAFIALFGPGKAVQWNRVVEATSHVIYFMATTGVCLQTLGEEYVGLVQIDGSKVEIPGKFRRIALILAQSLFPLVMDVCTSRVERHLLSRSEDTNFVSSSAKWLSVCELVRLAVEAFPAINVALFYTSGDFFHLGKRLLGIQYVKSHKGPGHVSKLLYSLIGWATVARLLARYWSILTSIKRRIEARVKEAQINRSDSTNSSSMLISKCPLCLEQRKHTTSAICGHLFCWSCILQWSNSSRLCPICRVPYEPSQLIYLFNYN